MEELNRVGIHSANLFYSLGIFALAIILLISLLLLYFLSEFMHKRINKVKYVTVILGKKLFYNAWIRYLITSNLKITHNAIFIMYLKASFDSLKTGVLTSFNILLLLIILIWPLFLTIFLLCNHRKLENKRFQKKFHTMFLGNRIRKKRTFLYHTVFCLRRLLLVLSFFIYYDSKSPKVIWCFLAI